MTKRSFAPKFPLTFVTSLAGCFCLVASSPMLAQEVNLEELEAQLKREQAKEAARQAESNRKAEAARRTEAERRAAEAARGTLIVRADHDCVLTINGETMGLLKADQVLTRTVIAGQSLIVCMGDNGSRAEVTERVPAGEQVVIKLETAKASAAASATTQTIAAGDERAQYEAAFTLLKEGRYAEATRSFQGFLVQFPTGEYSANAQYWLAEGYYVTQNYQIALESFQRLLNQFPTSAKVPDALLKVGYCQYELQQWSLARDALSQVIQRYPDTPVARLAQARLRALGLENR